NGNVFAIFVSGDGAWAGLDQQIAGALAKAGIPVVGGDSRRYFWSERTPQGFATDLDRIYRHYSHLWQRGRVGLIGFSQGADVLPAAYNQLPE
ncbi:virulence factor, partial [Xanthomonas sacchari]|uniref:virulence factor n=1 Tax=Xanthomonas sacchari TaxID=56458 RepID=UPI00225E3306